MPPPLAELTAQAQTLTAEGDLAGARAVLAGALDPAEIDPHRASPDLALAAALQARILIALGDAHAARTWAGFAHAAEERLHGPRDERTIAAAATHAAVLHRVGNHGRAAQLYHDLVGELTAVEGPLSPRVLAAEADLATAEHAAGYCTAARARLADAWARYREAYGDASAPGIKMLARLGAMERECARTTEGNEHLALAQELCARHLPADHSLAQQVARLAGAPPTGRHVCGRVQRSTGPVPAPAPGPAEQAPGAPPAPPIFRSAQGGPAPDISRMPATIPGVHPVLPEPAVPGEPTGRHAVPEPPIPLPLTSPAAPPPGPGTPAASEEAGTPPSQWPAHGHVAQALAAVHDQAVPPGPDPAVRPVDATAQPADPVVAPLGPYPPDSFPPAASAPGAYPPGPRLPVDRASAKVADRLPVPVERPGESANRQPFILATVLVAGVAAAAAIVAVTLPRGDDAGPSTAAPPVGAAATTAPATSAPAAAPPSGAATPAPSGTVNPIAPVDVRLRDRRDSVALTWRYPKGSEGPVLISGGRAGQEQRAFQQLPAGTTDYVVYGLNEQNNYCFSVAVVYTVDKVAASRPICTDRR
ncbi:fibronectin type III domain-containing protein [Couchioplanes caeruleus]|uniref:fibronectin type III domain-containing protein n=1 Tax=Couchioplanes caeruleus TaxID=56438 RepID=UPI0020BEFE84|nr:fibronectin type III domain-containing protein [Couchioplanes caeruleus]UQU66775.1 fibronectin type III domain-containing protein [Couchioplanes caeruleus]